MLPPNDDLAAPMTIAEERAHQLMTSLSGRHIAVLGDVMLDRYYRGSVSRISPEAPVPIVEVDEEREYPGGAANVAYNLATLGASPLLLGVAGTDRMGEHLRDLLDRLGIGSIGIIPDPSRPTTVKTRVTAASQQIVRIDQEQKRAIDSDVRTRLLQTLLQRIGTLDGLILQDYNKGVIGPELILDVLRIARQHDLPVYVDPKFTNFFAYEGATLFKPNRKEAEDALGRSLHAPEDLVDAVRTLQRRLQCDHVVLTLGSEGMMLYSADGEPVGVPTRAMQVADVSGAGDTVIATLAAAAAAGASILESVMIANHAAGIVCGRIGTVPVEHADLLDALVTDSREIV